MMQKGMTAARTIRSLAVAKGNAADAQLFAETQGWLDRHAITRSLDTSGAEGLLSPASVDFVEALRPLSLVGRLALRRVPERTKLVINEQGAAVAWTAERGVKLVTDLVLGAVELEPRKVAAMLVVSAEILRSSSVAAERLLLADLAGATAEALDVAFLDADGDGTDEAPASITHGAPTRTATADLDADLRALLDAFTGNLGTAAWIMSPSRAARLALARGTGGALLHPNLGATGGALAGVAVFTSEHAPPDEIILIDQAAIAFADSGAILDVTRHATLDLDETALVSLWQRNLVALRAERFVAWQVLRAGSVQRLVALP